MLSHLCFCLSVYKSSVIESIRPYLRMCLYCTLAGVDRGFDVCYYILESIAVSVKSKAGQSESMQSIATDPLSGLDPNELNVDRSGNVFDSKVSNSCFVYSLTCMRFVKVVV